MTGIHQTSQLIT